MRKAAIIILAVLISVTAILVFRTWPFVRFQSPPPAEVVQLTPEKRAVLQRLRAEHKFQPHPFPPLGYTGVETPEDEVTANRAVNGVIDAVLAKPDGPLKARTVIGLIRRGMRPVRALATEDRERTQDYMVEVWYLLGFRTATGLFAYGSGYPIPPGYGEPLPAGWTSPDKPRPIS